MQQCQITQHQSRCSPAAGASGCRRVGKGVATLAAPACQPVPLQQLATHRLRQQLVARQQPRSCRQPIAADRRSILVASSQPDTEEARSPLDAPQEWEAPQPSKRPDIFPDFEKMERVFLPKPLPGDPELPDEEEEEAKKRTEPGDPDPEAPPGEPSEPEPGEPGGDPEKETNIPTVPE